jgi:hypothetical protein
VTTNVVVVVGGGGVVVVHVGIVSCGAEPTLRR